MNVITLKDDDVVCINVSQNFTKTTTSKVSEVKYSMITEWLKGLGNWMGDGVDGSLLLSEGGGWQKGRFRLRMEFIPNQPKASPKPPDDSLSLQPQSPLDDLRANLS